jgi:hypothetical protein
LSFVGVENIEILHVQGNVEGDNGVELLQCFYMGIAGWVEMVQMFGHVLKADGASGLYKGVRSGSFYTS